MRYLLCRPVGGLNDTLNEIYKCYEYARIHKRTLLIDTEYDNYISSFDKYFFFFETDVPVIYNTLKIKTILLNEQKKDATTVFPPILKGVLTRYRRRYDGRIHYNDIPLKLDFTQPHDEDIVVHHSTGSMRDGIKLLDNLVLTSVVLENFKKRYAQLPQPYTAIHIRNTDIKTDYIEFAATNADSLKGPVFVATDSKEVLDYFRTLPSIQVYSFVETLDDENRPIHSLHNKNDKHRVMIDTLCDLVILALSSKLLISKKPFGFSRLAYDLWKHSDVLDRFIDYAHISTLKGSK